MARSDSLIKLVLLHLVLIFCVIFNVFDVGIIGFSNILPLVDVAAIFYFAIYQRYVSTWFVFLIGVWADSLMGNALGVSSLCYIVLVSLFSWLNNKMYIREGFGQIWVQFVVFCFLFLFCRYLVLAAINSTFYDMLDLFVRFVITSSLYASLHKLFDYMSRKLMEDD